MLFGFAHTAQKVMCLTVESPGGSKESKLRAKMAPKKGGGIVEDNKGVVS